MTEREKKLLRILGLVAVLSLAGLIAATGMERLRETTSSIERYQSQIARVEARASEDPLVLAERIAELETAVTALEEQSRAREGVKTNVAEFGASVRKELTARGAALLRYQLVGEKNEGALEFAARGSALSLARFLNSAMSAGWKIPFLSVRAESSAAPIEFVFRIEP